MSNVNHQACPYESCGSTDAFSWNPEGYGKCHSCDMSYPKKNMPSRFDWVKDKYPLPAKGSEGPKDDFATEDDSNEPVVVEEPKANARGSFVSMRGIKANIMEKFGVTTTDTQQFYPYPSGASKIRKLPKEGFAATNGFAADELFGMNLFPAGCNKMITIVEGELDALSAYQMINKGGSYVNPVVSLPSANPSGKFYKKMQKYLDSFEKIILATDNDKQGNQIASKLALMFGAKVYQMNLGDYKDPNEMLQDGQMQAFTNAWWGAKLYSPAGFMSEDDLVKSLTEENPYTFVEVPILNEQGNPMRIIRGGISILKAPPGTGKTSLLRYISHHLVTQCNVSVSALFMEEMASTTARGLATYEIGKNVNTLIDAEESWVSPEEVEEAVRAVVQGDKFTTFTIDTADAIESTLQQIKNAVVFHEADFIFIDHLQRLAYLSGVDNATNNLTELGVKLVEFSKEANIGIVCISHVNSDGRTKYASAIEEEAIVVLELERNKETEDEDEKNTTIINQSKNRPFGTTGYVGALRYDPDTTTVEPLEDRPQFEGQKEPDF